MFIVLPTSLNFSDAGSKLRPPVFTSSSLRFLSIECRGCQPSLFSSYGYIFPRCKPVRVPLCVLYAFLLRPHLWLQRLARHSHPFTNLFPVFLSHVSAFVVSSRRPLILLARQRPCTALEFVLSHFDSPSWSIIFVRRGTTHIHCLVHPSCNFFLRQILSNVYILSKAAVTQYGVALLLIRRYTYPVAELQFEIPGE